jgi:hypothetical protein
MREHGRTYLILTNNAIDPVGFEPDHGWPCFAPVRGSEVPTN